MTTILLINLIELLLIAFLYEAIACILDFFYQQNFRTKQLKRLFLQVIVKASSGPRYVVGCRSKVDKEKLTSGTRVVLDMTTLTIMRTLPREVYLVFKNHLPFSLEHFCRTFYCRSNFFKQKSMIWDLKLLFSPLQVDPVVYNMLHEDPGNVSYSAVGGLSDQIRELRESIELPLMNPELFLRVGIKPPKVNPTLFVLRSLIVHVM